MQTQTKTQTRNILDETVENILVFNGNRELRDRVIGKYLCTISRNPKNLDEIDEKTYEEINGEWKYVCVNHIPKGHLRYDELSDKLNREKL